VESSAGELTAEENYQLKPASRDQREMVTSLRGREPGSRGTSAVEGRCQATLVKTVKGVVLLGSNCLSSGIVGGSADS
jgi:hypothetical protein